MSNEYYYEKLLEEANESLKNAHVKLHEFTSLNNTVYNNEYIEKVSNIVCDIKKNIN